MAPPSSSQQARTRVAQAIFDIDTFWAEIFADTEINDLNYCDLFTALWLHREDQLRKTDLYRFMPNISERTAVKYVQRAIDSGLLLEWVSDADRRVRVVTMSDGARERMERFLDYTFDRFRRLG